MPFDSTPRPGTFHPRIREGKTYRRVLTWTIDGDPVDLSGAVVRVTTRRRGADEPVIELTEGDGVTVDGGEITFEYTAEQTETDLSGSWDLTVEFPNGDEIQLLAGTARWDRTAGR